MSKHSASFGVISPRHRAALEILDTLNCCRLTEFYGESIERSTDKKGKQHWSLIFGLPRTLDAVIRVYSDRFILLTCQTGGRDYRQVFTSPEEAKSFIVQTFYR